MPNNHGQKDITGDGWITVSPSLEGNLSDQKHYNNYESDPSDIHVLNNEVSICCAIFLFVTIIAGVAGNLLIFQAVRKSKTLKTVMNALVVNLAIIDIISALLLTPLRMALVISTSFGESLGVGFCAFHEFITTLSCSVQLLSLCAISLERYKAIADPFDTDGRLKRVKAGIILSWFLGVTFSALDVIFRLDSPSYLRCMYIYYDMDAYVNKYALYLLVPLSFVATVLILVFYGMIMLALKKHSSSTNKTLKKKPEIEKDVGSSIDFGTKLMKKLERHNLQKSEESIVAAALPLVQTNTFGKVDLIPFPKTDKTPSTISQSRKNRDSNVKEPNIGIKSKEDNNVSNDNNMDELDQTPNVSYVPWKNKNTEAPATESFDMDPKTTEYVNNKEQKSSIIVDSYEPKVTRNQKAVENEAQVERILNESDDLSKNINKIIKDTDSLSAKLQIDKRTSYKDINSSTQSKLTNIMNDSEKEPKQSTASSDNKQRSFVNIFSAIGKLSTLSSSKNKVFPINNDVEQPVNVGFKVMEENKKINLESVSESTKDDGAYSQFSPLRSISNDDKMLIKCVQSTSLAGVGNNVVSIHFSGEKEMDKFNLPAETGNNKVSSKSDLLAEGEHVDCVSTTFPPKITKLKSGIHDNNGEITQESENNQVSYKSALSSDQEQEDCISIPFRPKNIQSDEIGEKLEFVNNQTSYKSDQISDEGQNNCVSVPFRPKNKGSDENGEKVEIVNNKAADKSPPISEEKVDCVSIPFPRKSGKMKSGSSRQSVTVTVHDYKGRTVEAQANDQVVGAVCVMTNKNKEKGRRKLEGKAAKRASVVIGAFLFIFLPLPLTYLVTCNLESRYRSRHWVNAIELFALSLASFTAAINPIIYGLVNRQFKTEFVKILKQIPLLRLFKK